MRSIGQHQAQPAGFRLLGEDEEKHQTQQRHGQHEDAEE